MPSLTDQPDLTVFAKSPWSPSIRREHAWAREAAGHGLRVRFLERPLHVRNGGARLFLDRSGTDTTTSEGIRIVRTATVVPGHRARWAEAIEVSVLRRAAGPLRTAVVNLPWHWRASNGAARRVLDLADDWARLQPRRATRIRELYRRIADEADEIVAVNADLDELFPGRDVTVVANCASRDLLDRPLSPIPGTRRMAYLGTVTERFDHDLVAGILDALPGWSFDVIGPLSFAGRGGGADEGFQAFLDRFGPRVVRHGSMPRGHVGRVLDTANVLVIPNRLEFSRGQDSMKLYDYAAHGRPIVSTLPVEGGDPCPHVRVATDVDQAVDAVTATDESGAAAARRAWAARNTWDVRAPQWLGAVLGRPVDASRRDAP